MGVEGGREGGRKEGRKEGGGNGRTNATDYLIRISKGIGPLGRTAYGVRCPKGKKTRTRTSGTLCGEILAGA
jgi:hypothetical protein